MEQTHRLTGEDRAAPPSDPADPFEPEFSGADTDHSLMDGVSALFDDGKTYIQAELAYQKSRAGYTANRMKGAALYGAVAFGLLHLALIALTVGIVLALTPLIGAWLATGAVVVALIVVAIVFLLKLRGQIEDVRGVFDRGDA